MSKKTKTSSSGRSLSSDFTLDRDSEGETRNSAAAGPTSTPFPRGRTLLKNGWHSAWPPTIVVAALLGFWLYAIPAWDVAPYIFPSLQNVVKSALNFEEHRWLYQAGVTASEVGIGFGIATILGITCGFAIAWSKWISRALMPLVVVFNTLPKIALAPLFLIWFGYGVIPNSIIAAAVSFFPYVVNTSVGLTRVDEDLIELARVLHAPKWRVFVSIRLPTAVPYIMSAMKLGGVLSVIGAIVGEFLAAQAGLGYMITSAQTQLKTDVVFGAIFWISVLGVAVYAIIGLLEKIISRGMGE